MRAVVAHPPGANVRDLRQALLGAGFRCLAEDCVEWDELPPRVARGDADLLVMQTDQNAHANWDALREARQMTSAPAIAVGPTHTEAVTSAQQSGVVEYVDEGNLTDGLDTALAHMQDDGAIRPQRGTIIAVTAPLAGCGRTTVALNLAAALARKFPQEAAFIEIAQEGSQAADWLGLAPDHPADELFGRHHRLDAASLKAAFTRHPGGLNLVLNSPEVGRNPKLDTAGVKRLGVLARVATRYTVLAVDRPESEVALAALKAADTVLLVIRGDVPSVKRARRLHLGLTAAGIQADKIQIVLNRDGAAGQLSSGQVEAGLGFPINHRIPEDVARVNRAMNYGEFVVESWGSRLARGFRSLSDAVAGQAKEGSWWSFGS